MKAIGATITAGIFGTRLAESALAGCGQCDNGQFCYQGNCCSLGDDGDSCSTAGDCCGGYCNDGLCNYCGTGTACDGECCSGFTCDQESFTCQPSITCSPADGECTTSEDCCDDLVCSGFGSCQVTCSLDREGCQTGEDCCAGYFCQETASGLACIAADACLVEGDPCQSDQVGPTALVSICCEGYACIEDVCVSTCSAEGEACGVIPSGGNNILCCDGLDCVDDVCVVPPTCIPVGDACDQVISGGETALACCDSAACVEGICVTPDSCGEEGAACHEDADCCEGICCAGYCRTIECCVDDILDGGNPNDRCPKGTACFEGYCDPVGGEEEPEPETPVVLPNTGSGKANSNSGAIIAGLGVAGAAAIVIGNRINRPTVTTTED